MEFFSNSETVGKTKGIQPIASKLGFQEKWTATGNGFVASVYGNPTVLEKEDLAGLVMSDTVATIPPLSLLVRRIDIGKFD